MSASGLSLTAAISDLGHHHALLDGSVTVPGVEFEFVGGFADHAEMFRRMGRDLEFDVCELSAVTYLAMREFDLPVRAIPVAPRHAFHHGDFVVNADAGIRSPKDLEGRRIGTRTWTVTPGVLDRGILVDEFGVDLDAITWVLAEPEHVAGCAARYGPNVVPGHGEDLFPRMVSGELDGGIAGANLRRRRAPEVVPLFPDAPALDRAQYERTGIVPVFTVIAVAQAAWDAHPWLAEALFEAFRAARARSVAPTPGVARIVEDDPNPFGLAANRASLEELLRLAREQGIIRRPFSIDELFPALD